MGDPATTRQISTAFSSRRAEDRDRSTVSCGWATDEGLHFRETICNGNHGQLEALHSKSDSLATSVAHEEERWLFGEGADVWEPRSSAEMEGVVVGIFEVLEGR